MKKNLHRIFMCFAILLLPNFCGMAANARLLLPNSFDNGISFFMTGIGGTQDDSRLYTSSQLTVSNLYPNPADNYVELNYTIQENLTEAKLTIRNVLGVVVGEYALLNNGSKLHIDVSRLAAGVYFYTLSLNNRNIATKKLLIRN
jgi:hypothetical protein